VFTCLDAERRRGADFNNAALTSLLCPLGFRCCIIEGWLELDANALISSLSISLVSISFSRNTKMYPLTQIATD
jgi:hypothetical protein